MAAYDIFLKNPHSERIAQLMVKNNKRCMEYLSSTYFHRKKLIKMLEVGPGKGYLKDAVLGGKKGNFNIMQWIGMRQFWKI